MLDIGFVLLLIGGLWVLKSFHWTLLSIKSVNLYFMTSEMFRDRFEYQPSAEALLFTQ